jgi:UDPglucose 6-dehydrogenase
LKSMRPDSVVVGVDSERAAKIMRTLYAPFVKREPGRYLEMDPVSAETVKYAKNAFLATKISFANEAARFCEAAGADYDLVRIALGQDRRIGPDFLYSGPGWGGSCFPKDTKAFLRQAQDRGVDLSIVETTIASNERQKLILPEKVSNFFDNNLEGRTLALWGLAFKALTDDIRESPALSVIDALTAKGATIQAYDPQAMSNAQRLWGGKEGLRFATDEYEALRGVDALVIATNWKEFSNPDLNRMLRLMKAPLIFDGRNVMVDPEALQKAGFYYASNGRAPIDGRR